MRSAGALPLLFALLLTTACYHQVVQTGATPGAQVVERPWTATWLFGLVPATEISTAAECPGGVAVIETQQTFLNGLVGALTLGIYTPQTVRITCAGGDDASAPDDRTVRVADFTGADARVAATHEAVRLAQRTGEPVLLHLGH
jgi:Bor protein